MSSFINKANTNNSSGSSSGRLLRNTLLSRDRINQNNVLGNESVSKQSILSKSLIGSDDGFSKFG